MAHGAEVGDEEGEGTTEAGGVGGRRCREILESLVNVSFVLLKVASDDGAQVNLKCPTGAS